LTPTSPAPATTPKAILKDVFIDQILLFEKLWPEIWQSEDLLKEDVVLRASSGPFVKLVQKLNVVLEVIDRLHL
jgi:hypothetical protein